MAPPTGDAASVCGSAAASCMAPNSAGSSGSSAMINVDPNLRKCLAEVDTMLAVHVAAWMKKRGKSLHPKLSDEQKKQLEECYELMDADGSGAIDADELGAAFKLLGIDVSKSEIAEMLDEVDEDGSGEVEYPEFIEIMTSTLAKLAHNKEEEGEAGNQVPFALLATAYRRKRIMEGLISGDREVMAQVTTIAETATRRAAEEAQQLQLQQQQQQQARKGRKQASNQPSNLPSMASTPNSTAGARSSIFRSPVSSHTGSVDSVGHRTSGDSDPGALAAAAAAAAAAAGAAAGDVRASQVAAQAGIPSGLLRALQHVKSFCSSHGGSSHSSALTSPTSSNPGSKSNSVMVTNAMALLLPGAAGPAAAAAAAGGGVVGTHVPWGISTGSGVSEEDFWDLPAEAIAGVLDIEEQRQLISILRAKTRKRLEAVAAVAAAAGQPGSASVSPSRWPTASGVGPASCNVTVNGSIAAAGSCAGAGGGGCAGGGAGGSSTSSSSGSNPVSELEGLVGAKQRMTSKLMLKLLTQEFEPPKFALPSPAQRSGSTIPTPGFTRGTRSASTTPTPYKQPLVSHTSTGANGSSSTSSSPQRPSAAAAAVAAAAEGPGEQGDVGVALQKGINFGDMQIHEFNSAAANANSRSGSGPLGMTRSNSLGDVGSTSCPGTSPAAAAAAAAATGQQVGSGGTLAVTPQVQQQQQQQQQQQWVPVPQLPRMSGAVCPPAAAHSRSTHCSRSGSPVCVGGVKHSSSTAVTGSWQGIDAGAIIAPAAAAAAAAAAAGGGKTSLGGLKLQPSNKRVR